MAEKTRRVMILCADPASIAEAKKNYGSIEGDEEHYFYTCSDALEWLLVENAVGSPPDLSVIDLETENCQGFTFLSKSKYISPKVFSIGFYPSLQNNP